MLPDTSPRSYSLTFFRFSVIIIVILSISVTVTSYSVTVSGYLYDHGHLSRAVCCRLDRHVADDVMEIPQGYRVNHPHLGRVTSYEAQRGTDKTKAISLNWAAGDQTVEIVDGTLGQIMTR